MIEYLDEIEIEFENILACLSEAQIGFNHEQTGGRKSRDTLPLKRKVKLAKVNLQQKFYIVKFFLLLLMM